MLPNTNMNRKLQNLEEILARMESVLIAYSGGTDSTLLLKIAKDTLGEKVLAVTANSPTYSSEEMKAAEKMAKTLAAKHLIIETQELADPNFVTNPPDRCYHCKQELFRKLGAVAKERDLNYVLDGSNYDDLSDFRPGMRAGQELGVRSPLKEAMLTKEDIRKFSKELGLPTWDKPSLACLASRFPYGTMITEEVLVKLDKAERFIKGLKIAQVRVRHHGTLARIEVLKEDLSVLVQRRDEIVRTFKDLGYTYVTVDLQGYRTGSMNETLERSDAG